MSFANLKIVSHPLLDGMRFQKLLLKPDVPVSDAFRAEFNGWLLEMFGTEERAFIIPKDGTVFLSPKQFAMLKGLP